MLYGNKNVRDIILEDVRRFELNGNRKVIFGAMVGSISKGVERYDSDYDTRFLYLDRDGSGGYKRWDRLDNLEEKNIHICSYPEDTTGFYDKVAYWEATSFFDFLRNPILDGKYSVGLYHIVGWTIKSPYIHDPYGLSNKIQPLLDAMFRIDYEIGYYRNYIEKCLSRPNILMREYLYSAYYALAIQYMERHDTFAPYYFDTILAFCENKELAEHILRKKDEYYILTNEMVRNPKNTYKRKMANFLQCERDGIIDRLLYSVLDSTKEYKNMEFKEKGRDYVNQIIEVALNAFDRPTVKSVNE